MKREPGNQNSGIRVACRLLLYRKMNAERDPVCGMQISEPTPHLAFRNGQTLGFCSDFCREAYLQAPARYVNGDSPEPRFRGPSGRTIAYFSMELFIHEQVPAYSGGLGVLAGDMIRTFADLEVPAVAVSLVYRKGYFDQRLNAQGDQQELEATWDPSRLLKELSTRVQVQIEGRQVLLKSWQFDVPGEGGFSVPVILLDSGLPENAPADRDLTSVLYGGDERYRLSQEIILGIGGLRMLRALGYTSLSRYHMNEGHSSLLAVELLRESRGPELDFAGVRDRCVFTTHTPVAAGHDQFDYELVRSVLGEALPLKTLQMLAGQQRLNMTLLALNLSRYVNGVAKKHSVVSQEMFPGYPIHSITNGVHSRTWTSAPFARLYDRTIPGWGSDPFSLRHAMAIPDEDLWNAHQAAKAELLAEVNRRTAAGFKLETPTLGFARRATAYKRADLLFSDPGRLRQIAREAGGLQIVFGGKAHPRDGVGKDLIRSVFRNANELRDDIRIVYLENYDVRLAKLCTSGSDLWLNTPLPPMEASGTSGMKAAHNGVPSFSVLDGWWLEGCIDGVTGWSIGDDAASDLYRKLQGTILPLFLHHRDRWMDITRHSIALNASHFNAHRMVQQYAAMAYA